MECIQSNQSFNPPQPWTGIKDFRTWTLCAHHIAKCKVKSSHMHNFALIFCYLLICKSRLIISNKCLVNHSDNHSSKGRKSLIKTCLYLQACTIEFILPHVTIHSLILYLKVFIQAIWSLTSCTAWYLWASTLESELCVRVTQLRLNLTAGDCISTYIIGFRWHQHVLQTVDTQACAFIQEKQKTNKKKISQPNN